MTWILALAAWDDLGAWDDGDIWLDSIAGADPSLKQIVAFPLILDGHEMYAIRLGDDETLLYDLTTGSWSSWDSPGQDTWRANAALNWVGVLGSGAENAPTTNVILGDDKFGILWMLNPEAGQDDGPFDGDTAQPFTRAVTGGIPIRGRPSPRCNAVYLTASIGDLDMVNTSIQLRYSDDNGRTYITAGTSIVQPGLYTTELRWRSLGMMKAPGRIFEFIDSGATVRLDGADARLDNKTE